MKKKRIDPLLWAGTIGLIVSIILHFIIEKPFSPVFYLVWLIFLIIGLLRTFRNKADQVEEEEQDQN